MPRVYEKKTLLTVVKEAYNLSKVGSFKDAMLSIEDVYDACTSSSLTEAVNEAKRASCNTIHFVC